MVKKVHKLCLFGHYPSDKNKTATSYYSWPRGISVDDALKHIDGFMRAFTTTKVEIDTVTKIVIDR
jgi:hypothetical protein